MALTRAWPVELGQLWLQLPQKEKTKKALALAPHKKGKPKKLRLWLPQEDKTKKARLWLQQKIKAWTSLVYNEIVINPIKTGGVTFVSPTQKFVF